MLLQRLDDGRAVPLDVGPSGRQRADEAHQLDVLLGEQLLPVRTRRGPDDPHLLAVDASGQPVVVEVVGRLDEAAVLRALHHAGQAARMTTAQIAATYPGGPDRFATHVEAFRRTVPASSQLSTSVRSGARLMLVCSEVDQRLGAVLEFLLQPGYQVEVLRTRVSVDSRGSRVVEVVPVERTAPAREVAARRAEDPPGGSTPEAVPVPEGPREPADHRRPAPPAPVPTVVAPAFATVRDAGPAGVGPLSGDDEPDAVETPEPAEPTESGDPAVTADPVAELAERLGSPTVLVWYRERRGQRHEALLHLDGSVELPDGTVVPDLDAAAVRVSGTVVDGAAVWRVGDRWGPTVEELLV